MSDEEYASAYAQSDNRRIMASVAHKFRKVLSEHDCESCQLEGLWLTLCYHRDGFGKKFTSSLYMFTEYRLIHMLRSRRARNQLRFVAMPEMLPAEPALNDVDAERLGNVRDCLRYLPRADRELLEEVFVGNSTLEEIGQRRNWGKETVRIRSNWAVGRLRELCAGEMSA